MIASSVALLIFVIYLLRKRSIIRSEKLYVRGGSFLTLREKFFTGYEVYGQEEWRKEIIKYSSNKQNCINYLISKEYRIKE